MVARDANVDSIDETVLWRSPSVVIRASTSSIVRRVTVPVTAGTIMRTVLFRAVTMLARDASTVGTTLVVTSFAMATAG